MNAKEAKKLLSSVPKEDFIIETFSDKVSKCCAIGHLVRLKSQNPSDFAQNLSDWEIPEINDFRMSSLQFIKEKHKIDYDDISSVNNYDNINGYTEDNPKDRVLHLLDDMIEAGY